MSNPLPLSRRDTIEARLTGGIPVVATSLAIEFGVSEDAIRRDLRMLAAEGKCRRVYGGALPFVAPMKLMSERIGQAPERKAALARAAVETINAGELIFLDCSSTNSAMVGYLPQNMEITTATNSIDIAGSLLRRGGIPLLFVGGSVDANIGGCIDSTAIEVVNNFNIDRCFVGACSVSVSSGLSTDHHADAVFKRALLKRSAVVTVLATTEKFRLRSSYCITGLSEIDLIIVESDLPEEEAVLLERGGISLIRSPCVV